MRIIIIALLLIASPALADKAADLKRGVPQAIISACTADAMRLCSAAIFTFDRGQIVACMNSNRASLSTACRAAIARH